MAVGSVLTHLCERWVELWILLDLGLYGLQIQTQIGFKFCPVSSMTNLQITQDTFVCKELNFQEFNEKQILEKIIKEARGKGYKR